MSISKESVFEELGSGQPTAAYGRFVGQGLDEETEIFYSKDKWPAVRGSAGFVDKAHLHALSESREVKKYQSVKPFKAVVGVVSEYYGCSVAAIVHSKRGRQERNTARWMAMKLSQEHTEMTLLELAREFHVGSYGAISTTVGKLNELLVVDGELLESYDELSEVPALFMKFGQATHSWGFLVDQAIAEHDDKRLRFVWRLFLEV